jgi:hypothetical protein
MTDIVEKFTLTVTLNHEQVKSAVYHPGGVSLRDKLRELWPRLVALIDIRDRRGRLQIDGVLVEWASLGIEEEAGAGDN